MDKLLKVFVAILLLLSIAALVLGLGLFGKRELLKARTQTLENAVIAVGAAIEAEAPEAEREPDYPERDISPCTDEVIESPELTDFWGAYEPALESQDQAALDLKPMRPQLMSYYRIDPVTGKPMRDATGVPITTGPGTMQDVLDLLLSKAGDQYTRLNRTRQQLSRVRAELVETIKAVNARKNELRVALGDITDLKGQIEPLKQEIASLNDSIAILNEEKEALENDILDQKDQIARAVEKNQDLEAQIERLKEENDALRQAGSMGEGARVADGAAPEAIIPALPTGTKGRVAAVHEKWNFVIIELSEPFTQELQEAKLEGRLAGMELMVKRPAKDGRDVFVTKVRLTHVKPEQQLGVADILNSWQQMPVREGDVVFY
ncbi:MAG: hypothetical protein JW951_10640 [Lentisphaerae bacterium]|nr:hypothetical protein [Lentisphaerota bacterium]